MKKSTCGLATQDPSETVPAEPYLIYGGESKGIFMQTKLVPFTEIDSLLHE